MKSVKLAALRERLAHGGIQLFIAFDQLLNVLSNPFSKQTWADETISSRCGRLGHRYPYKVYKVVIDALFFWQGPNHCVNAYLKEKTRYHFPPEMRGTEPANCALPPAGWYCTRAPKHEGPCAAWPMVVDHADTADADAGG